LGEETPCPENQSPILILQNIGEYVDWDSGEVRFDSSDFKTMLEVVKTFPAADGRSLMAFTQIK
jgi:hypothetical protein